MITLATISGMPSFEPSLDTWTSIFFVVSIFGLFFSSLFFLKGRHSLKTVWPIPVMIFGYSIVLFQYSLFWTKYLYVFPFLHFTLGAWFLSFGPLIYTYTRKFCHVRKRYIFLHFVPALISFIISFALLLIRLSLGSVHYRQNSTWVEFLQMLNNPWVAIASMSVYLLLAKLLWNRTKHKSSRRIASSWMNVLHLAFLLFILSYASYFILVQFPFFNQQWDYGIAVGMSIGVFTIGVFVYYEPALFNGEVDWFAKDTNEYDFSSENSDQFYSDIVSRIRQDELFLNGDLRLAHLADSVGLSLHDASRIINQHSEKNFNQFINDFRVERAQELLHSTDLSVKEICFVSGFNSKVTFYAAFKAKTNQTPVEYRKTSISDS